MELRHLRYFVTVAEELNFSRAAVRLNISQPPLSQQIQQLESELGVPLFYRTKRKVELTDSGKVFLGKAYKILFEVEKACDHTKKAYEGKYGQLVIGFTGSATYDFIPLLQSYRAKFPLVEVIVHQMSTPEQVLALNEERIDVGLICTPIAIENSKLNISPIRRQHFIAVLPETHKMAKKKFPLEIRELAEDTFIMTPRQEGSVYYDTIMSIFHKVGFIPKITTAHVSTAVTSLVSAGMGVALLPYLLENLQMKGVVFKEITDTTTKIETAVAWRHNEKSSIVDPFITLVKEFVIQDSVK
ncbi:LysR family transcriptional regulator [Fictibacillus sp. WQ 8-8]|uniref:LysR family transcriptional regulator n=1 Tax=Fictibacillus arsenicus TaxID=255247 RepID=A0A1B1Z2D7_9BACL|nr:MULTISPECIES: LysR family transcriptional regulator [Fictibacillus]ANX11645.1 LysR family transcriptional regulator [Fictibacillus arsenicus]MCQ6266330.1 LysR family transcriptional regulator [Fictibacillus sp. WQ 8-8]